MLTFVTSGVGEYGKSLLRRRGELIERNFAHCYETGGMRRCHPRGRQNILKRQLIHVGVQPESNSAKAPGSGHATRAEKSRGPGGFATVALSAVPDDDPFTGPATYCRCWSAHRIISPLPHALSQVTKHEQFRHGLLATIKSRSTVIYACGPHREHGLGD